MRRLASLRAILSDICRHDSVLYRRAVLTAVRIGPDFFLRHSPPIFGLLCAGLLPDARRRVVANLRRVFGRRSRFRESLDMVSVFANFSHCLTEVFVAAVERSQPIVRCVQGEKEIRALDLDKGLIVVTAHVGGWQAAGSVLRSFGDQQVLVVMQRERDGQAQALQDATRASAGMRVHLSEGPLDALVLLSHLRKGGIVAIQIDRVPEGVRSRKVEFLGEASHIPEGPLRLASISGAPVVPAFARRVAFMEYEVTLGTPIFVRSRPSGAELDEAALMLAHSVEAFVRANPTQWFHFNAPVKLT